jgi:hypothetical protein
VLGAFGRLFWSGVIWGLGMLTLEMLIIHIVRILLLFPLSTLLPEAEDETAGESVVILPAA